MRQEALLPQRLTTPCLFPATYIPQKPPIVPISRRMRTRKTIHASLHPQNTPEPQDPDPPPPALFTPQPIAASSFVHILEGKYEAAPSFAANQLRAVTPEPRSAEQPVMSYTPKNSPPKVPINRRISTRNRIQACLVPKKRPPPGSLSAVILSPPQRDSTVSYAPQCEHGTRHREVLPMAQRLHNHVCEVLDPIPW
jgi:hypothetical protein